MRGESEAWHLLAKLIENVSHRLDYQVVFVGGNFAIAHAFPAMYYNAAVKGAFLKGTGFAVLWPQLLVFIFYACTLFGLCYLLFRKRSRT